MADYEGTTTVGADPDALFDYLAEIRNLPNYMARMTSAEPAEGEAVRTTARMPDGREVGGEAWFRVLQDQRRIEWGSEGASDYHGWLEVRAVDGGEGADLSEVEVHVATQRVDGAEAGDRAQGAVQETLAEIKRLVEEHAAAPPS